jgi:hypothetical protein
MPTVLFHAEHRLWLLRGPTTAYAVRLAEHDSVRHVLWCPALTLDQAAGIAERTTIHNPDPYTPITLMPAIRRPGRCRTGRTTG